MTEEPSIQQRLKKMIPPLGLSPVEKWLPFDGDAGVCYSAYFDNDWVIQIVTPVHMDNEKPIWLQVYNDPRTGYVAERHAENLLEAMCIAMDFIQEYGLQPPTVTSVGNNVGH